MRIRNKNSERQSEAESHKQLSGEMQEGVTILESEGLDGINKSAGLTPKELLAEVETLRRIYPDVRIVEPVSQLEMACDGYQIKPGELRCYNRCRIKGDGECRCKAQIAENRESRDFLMLKKDMYYTYSKPVMARGKNYVIQATERITDKMLVGNSEKGGFRKKLETFVNGLSIDDGSGAYTMRYLNNNIQKIMENAVSLEQNLCIADIWIRDKRDISGCAAVFIRNIRSGEDFVVRSGEDSLILIMQNIPSVVFIRRVTECLNDISISGSGIRIGCSSTLEDGIKHYKLLHGRSGERLRLAISEEKQLFSWEDDE